MEATWTDSERHGNRERASKRAGAWRGAARQPRCDTALARRVQAKPVGASGRSASMGFVTGGRRGSRGTGGARRTSVEVALNVRAKAAATICLPVLRFRQLAQLRQFSLRRQGVQSPHFFLFLFWRPAAVSREVSREASTGDREKSPACWCSVSMYLLRGDVFSEGFLCMWRDGVSSAPVDDAEGKLHD
ncbi:hypothetical protein EYF80_013399 [Liparis tanakae]|uniref:Uncharacterized protein n=1 Tax=Liparis tanakae TaxID=230148 RepID=A0A4Z2IEL7_9TELE|nr:hypothetical protein EYF80_013399 [Liparis tanakae]